MRLDRIRLKRGLVAAAFLVPAFFAGTATADDDAATAALKKGYELKKAGKCAEAVVFLRESFEKRPSAKAVLNLAECEESSGRFLTARAHYKEGKRLSESEKQPELASVADARIAAIEPRVPRVTFQVPAGAELSIDGTKQATPTDVEIDPGDHVAKVSGEGFEDGTESFSLGPGERRTVTLGLGARRSGPKPAQSATSPDGRPTSESDSTGRGQRVAGAVSTGAGLVLVGIGSVLALTAKSDYDAAVSASCDPTGCDAAGQDAISSTRGRAGVATLLFVAGGIATVGGVVLYFTAKKSPVRAGVAGTGIFLSGTF